MPDDDANLKPVTPKGYARISPELRARVSDIACLGAVGFTLVALFAAPDVSGVWLRLPVLLAQVVLAGGAWFVLRRMKDKAPVVLTHGVVVGLMLVALLAMAMHKVSVWISLSGFLAFLAALALRGASDRGLIRGRDIKKKERSFTDAFFDNIEGLAAALVLVLLVWHFGLEAFQIPTGSMAPTLVGSSVGGGALTDGDRVLVDKFVYHYRDPGRWEPVVFRYPLRRTDPYVKRCVALPGEQVLIARGDVYVKRHDNADVELLTKTLAARRVLWLPMMQDLSSRTGWVKNFQRDGDVDFSDGVISFGAGGSAVYPRGETDDEPGNILDHDASFGAAQTPAESYGHNVVGDVRLRCEVTLKDGTFGVTIIRDEDVYRLSLSANGCELLHINGDEHSNLAQDDLDTLKLANNEPFELSFALADGELAAHVDDQLVARVTVGTPLLDQLAARNRAGEFDLSGQRALEIAKSEPPGGRKSRIEMASENGRAAVELLGIERDVYYVGRLLADSNSVTELPFQVALGGDGYLVLGDNSPGSADCRAWTRITLFMEDGALITGALDPTSQNQLAMLLNNAVFEDAGVTALGRLNRVAQFSMDELGFDEGMQSQLVQGSLRKLKETADSTGRAAVDFYTEGGGFVRVKLAQVESIQVQAQPFVPRNLFVGRPFAVFLSPRGMKLID